MKITLPTVPKTARRKSLTLAFKRFVVQESLEIKSLRATARKYLVTASQIRRWKRSFEAALENATDFSRLTGDDTSLRVAYRRLQSTNRSRFRPGDRPPLLPAKFLSALHKVLLHRRANNQTVSMDKVLIEAKKLDPGVVDRVGPSAFTHRMYRMMKKWHLAFRRGTTNAKVPQNTRHSTELIKEFVEYFKFKVKLLNIEDDDIFNVDQTNMAFSLEAKDTWATKGCKSVPVAAAETSARATIMLGTNATGTVKLPPFIVFKGSSKRTGRVLRELQVGEGYPEGCHYTCQEKAWFNEEIMLQWIDTVWRPHVESRGSRLTYLLMDEFAVHLTASVEQAFVSLNTEVEIIPGGYTSKLQAMDVGINKPFKNHCRKQFQIWLEQNQTNDGTTVKPHRKDAAKWAKYAWDQITPRTIRKTWNHIGYMDLPIEDLQVDEEDIEFNSQGTTITDFDINESISPVKDIGMNVTDKTMGDTEDDSADDIITTPVLKLNTKKRPEICGTDHFNRIVYSNNDTIENDGISAMGDGDDDDEDDDSGEDKHEVEITKEDKYRGSDSISY
jgi:transposase-like protein